MIYRTFGRTNLRTSALAFGTWALGGPNTIAGIPIGWKPIAERQAASTINKAVDAGINLFETSGFYGQGRSEELLGRYLPKHREDILVATKVGLLPEVDPQRPQAIRRCFEGNYITTALEGSLRRLRREHADIYQLHGPDTATLQSEDTWSALERLKISGKVRYVGISVSSRHSTVSDLQAMLNNPLVDSIQIKRNVIQIRDRDILNRVSLNNRGVIARVPFEHGLLLGRYQDSSSFDEDDHRREMLSEARAVQFRRFREHLQEKLPERMQSAVEIPLSWLLSDSNVTVVLCGATSPEQVEANVEVLERPPLSSAECKVIEDIADEIFG